LVAGLLLFALFVRGIPMIFVLTDPIIGHKGKAIWVFAIGLSSWVAWLLCRFVAPILPRRNVNGFGEERRIPTTL
jgi:hypothetical protein